MTDPKRHWFDTSINLQTLATGVIGAAITLTVVYFTLVGRVSILEHDVRDLKDSASEKQHQTESSLNEIKGQVHDTNEKIDKLTGFLLQNSAGQRPDMQRWSK